MRQKVIEMIKIIRGGGKVSARVDDKHIYLQFAKQYYSYMVVKNIGIEYQWTHNDNGRLSYPFS